MTAALLARCPEKPIEAACQAVYWHGRAADVLAERNGQVAVRTTDLLDMYGPALMM
jgi:NAD(P)H-hydrate repair Nnr-like enzyme with NAD(P)H-hydrate dehydratase domain